ncbi:hypothetical protein GCM10023235_62820 [Kitasatospora terrestris]|uniref:Uncharacterized protein n=1 Tax=Kitasatospora terrestris TaxID=258051 RepID=A0ABP9EDZ5_9ACTN
MLLAVLRLGHALLLVRLLRHRLLLLRVALLAVLRLLRHLLLSVRVAVLRVLLLRVALLPVLRLLLTVRVAVLLGLLRLLRVALLLLLLGVPRLVALGREAPALISHRTPYSVPAPVEPACYRSTRWETLPYRRRAKSPAHSGSAPRCGG